ncbi:hypothetical protein EYC80_005675 [Monilinia laxa]|uniref:Uncharacterized protein n=1 Tax=Monilinia laxa TaxID=61186 RepID=A0A5N6KF68_MONLA|nr:hypothetical protein EYC80_005675 [Monilinia laxa]
MSINLPIERMLSRRRNGIVEYQVSAGYRIRIGRQRRGISSSSRALILHREASKAYRMTPRKNRKGKERQQMNAQQSKHEGYEWYERMDGTVQNEMSASIG